MLLISRASDWTSGGASVWSLLFYPGTSQHEKDDCRTSRDGRRGYIRYGKDVRTRREFRPPGTSALMVLACLPSRRAVHSVSGIGRSVNAKMKLTLGA